MSVLESAPGQEKEFLIQNILSLYGAVAMTRRLPFMEDLSEQDRVLIATVVSELGTNILKYAGSGSIRVQRLLDEGHDAIQVVAEDQGSGIDNVAKALEDHYSTSGTLGMGLPAVNRMMTSIAIQSSPGEGTRVIAKKWLNGSAAMASPTQVQPPIPIPLCSGCDFYDVGVAIRPMQGEVLSGDIAVVCDDAKHFLVGLIDVSGHGADAHGLARHMQQVVLRDPSLHVDVILERLHQQFHASRGAAVGLASLEHDVHRLTFAGVGNINIWRLGTENWRGVSRDGVIGQRMHSVYLQTVAFSPGDLLVMTSDGVSETIAQYLWGLYQEGMSAQEFSELILCQAGKHHDDASCLVLRCLA